jgi:hypothetical protein
MRTRTIILIFGLLTCAQLKVSGQFILTEQDNRSWTSKLRSEKDAVAQFEILRTRLLADTNVYVRDFGDIVILKSEKHKDKVEATCRPLLIVGGRLIGISNNTDAKAVEKLIGKLTRDNFKEIVILEDNQATALYGQTGMCGAILLTPKNKKVKKDIFRIKV